VEESKNTLQIGAIRRDFRKPGRVFGFPRVRVFCNLDQLLGDAFRR
jgi:hypothetical protein